jgi:hypothetical protein
MLEPETWKRSFLPSFIAGEERCARDEPRDEMPNLCRHGRAGTSGLQSCSRASLQLRMRLEHQRSEIILFGLPACSFPV